MTCPSTLTRSRYADGELPIQEVAGIEQHLMHCASCEASVHALGAESNALRSAMKAADATGVIPAFVPRPTIGRLLTWFGWAALCVWVVNVASISLIDATQLPAWLSWLAPNSTGVGFDLVFGTVSFLIREGGGLVDEIVESAKWLALATIAVGGIWFLMQRRLGRSTSLCLQIGAIGILIATVSPVEAFEIRRDKDRVTIPAGEIIDDTLIVLSEDVVVEGTVTGDLIVFGENVTITGKVGGMLVTGAETLSIEAEVAGSVLAAAETIDYRDATLLGNLFSAAETITLHSSTSISGNAALAASEAEIGGTIGRDLLAAGEEVTLLGTVAGSVKSYGKQFEATDTARIGGDLTVRTRSAEHLTIADGAVVGGEIDSKTRRERPKKYTTFKFYLHVMLKFLAAFVTGLALFYLLPALRRTRLDQGSDVLAALGLGAVALVATPLLAVMVTLTLIGAPIGIVTFVLWLVALYLAGIVAAGHLGRMFLDREQHGDTVPFLVGLLILSVLGIIPILGGLVGLLATLVGLGLFVQWFRGAWANRAT